MIGADVGSHDLVELLTDFDHAFPGLHIPNDGVPELPTATSAHDEQATVAAELERAGVALGVWQNARELTRVGIIEEDLLRCGDGSE